MSKYYIIVVNRGTKKTDVIRTTSRRVFTFLSEILEWAKPITLTVQGWNISISNDDIDYAKFWTGQQFIREILEA